MKPADDLWIAWLPHPDGRWAIRARSGHVILATVERRGDGEDVAIVRLAAAAPALLAALEAIDDARHHDADGDCVMCGVRVYGKSRPGAPHHEACPTVAVRAAIRRAGHKGSRRWTTA